MTSRGGRIAIGNVLPGGAGAQHPQDPVQHFARIAPRAAPAIGATMRFRNQRLEYAPLFVLEIHGSLLGVLHGAVGEQLTSKMRL